MPRILILGGGPAGSAAAITLARRGLIPTLLEAKPFPRAKVCGEFISPAALPLLGSLVGATALRRAGARPVRTLALHHAHRSFDWPLPTPALALSRAALDTLLLNQARAESTEILQPARVVTVNYTEETRRRRSARDPDPISIRLDSGDTLTADLIIHADGSGRHDPAGPVPMRRGVVALKCHLEGAGGLPSSIRPDAVHMRAPAIPGAYVGTVAVEHARATCALVARKPLLAAHRHDLDALLTILWPAYNPAQRTTDWLASGVPNSSFIPSGHPRSFRIGNAAAAVEPVGGEGIGLALWSGATLANLLAESCAASALTLRSLAHIHTTFASLYRARLRLRRPACRAAAEALMRPALTAVFWPTLHTPTLSLRPWYALTGKPLSA